MNVKDLKQEQVHSQLLDFQCRFRKPKFLPAILKIVDIHYPID